MLSGVCVGTNDIGKAAVFYDALLATINMHRSINTPQEIGYATTGDPATFFVLYPYNKKSASYGNGTQVMFFAPDIKAVHQFHETAIKYGGKDEGAPGPRNYSKGYYGAYIRDPDGNKLHVAIRL